MPYRIELKKSAAKAFDSLPRKVQRQIGDLLEKIAQDPRSEPPLLGYRDPPIYKRRTGDYRVVYTIEGGGSQTVTVLLIGNRRDVYDRLARLLR